MNIHDQTLVQETLVCLLKKENVAMILPLTLTIPWLPFIDILRGKNPKFCMTVCNINIMSSSRIVLCMEENPCCQVKKSCGEPSQGKEGL